MGQTNSNRAVENQDSIVAYGYVSGSNRVEDTTTTIKGLSNLTRATTAGYDAYNRLTSIATTPTLATIGYSYYASGHASEGKLAGVTNDSPPPLAAYTYAATGEPSSIALENGLTSAWTRDAAGQATSFLTMDSSSNVISGVSHGYDSASRRTWAAYEDSLGQSYAYDDAGQVTAAKVGISNPSSTPPGSSPTHSFAYDTAGNRTASAVGGASTSYTANNVNAYTVITGGGFTTPSPSHDAKGNCLILPRPDGSSLSMTWDKEDRLVAAAGATYVYDPFGRLIWKRHTVSSVTTDEIYTWHSWTLLSREIRQGSTPVETFRYTWGLDLSNTLEGAGGVGGLLAIEHAVGSSSSWAIRYAHADANGNILCLTDSSGNASARYRYSPFGELLTASDLDSSGWAARNIRGFSTKPLDATIGLHYYGYRWYDSPTGRWPSRDPIEERGGMNLYGFVGNDGVGKLDFLGYIIVEYPDPDRIPARGRSVANVDVTAAGEHLCSCDNPGKIAISLSIEVLINQGGGQIVHPRGGTWAAATGVIVDEDGNRHRLTDNGVNANGEFEIDVGTCSSGPGSTRFKLLDEPRTGATGQDVGIEVKVSWDYACLDLRPMACEEIQPFSFEVERTAVFSEDPRLPRP